MQSTFNQRIYRYDTRTGAVSYTGTPPNELDPRQYNQFVVDLDYITDYFQYVAPHPPMPPIMAPRRVLDGN